MKYKEIFTALYNKAPQSLKDEVDNTVGVKQSKVWHPEGDVFTHISLVTNRLHSCYSDINLTLAGFFHDLGKTATTFFNPKKDTYSAFGHEDESVVIMQKYKAWIKGQGADFELVEYIVANHMRIKHLDDMRLSIRMVFFNDPRFIYIQKFTSADYGGTGLDCRELPDNTGLEKQISDYYKYQEEKKTISARFNGNLVMGEYPHLKDKELGGVISKFKKSFIDFNAYALKSTREKIMDDFKTFLK